MHYLFVCLGPPDEVTNCSQLNHSADSIYIQCTPGFDGGLVQLFGLELRYLRPPPGSTYEDALVRNMTRQSAIFEVKRLEAGKRFEAVIYASNRKGRSLPVRIRVSTLKRPDGGKRLAATSSDSGKRKPKT